MATAYLAALYFALLNAMLSQDMTNPSLFGLLGCSGALGVHATLENACSTRAVDLEGSSQDE